MKLFRIVPALCMLSVFLFCSDETLFQPDSGTPTRCYAFVTTATAIDTSSIDTAAFRTIDTLHTADSLTFVALVTPSTAGLRSWGWRFGDGDSSTALVVRRRYARGGMYRAVFTIEDNVGLRYADTVTVCVNTPPEPVVLVSPVDGAGDIDPRTAQVRLSWSCRDPDGDTLTYLVYLNTSAVFVSPIGQAMGDASLWAAIPTTAYTTYHWQVRAVDKYRDTVTSAVREFTTIDPTASTGTVRGTAVFQGWINHTGIKVSGRATGGVTITFGAVTDSAGRYTVPDLPAGNYRVTASDTIKQQFRPDSTDLRITAGGVTVADTLILRDINKPVISAMLPTARQTIRRPQVSASFADIGSGVRVSSARIALNDSDVTVGATVTRAGLNWTSAIRLRDGAHRVMVAVSDSAGNMADTARWQFVVDAMKLTAMNDSVARINDTLTLHGRVSDVFSRVAQYRWDFDGNGTWDDSAATADSACSARHVYTRSGTYRPVLYCRDDSGMVKTDTMQIIVTNTGASVTVRGDTTISIHDQVTLVGSSADADGRVVERAWDAEGDGTFEFVSATDSVTVHTYNTVGVFRAVFRATDEDGKRTFDTVVVTVVVDRPSVTIMSDTTVRYTESLTVRASGTDGFGSVVRYLWDRGLDGWDDSTTTGSWLCSNPTGGWAKIAVAVRDDDGLLSEVDTITVLFNRPPTGGLVTAPTANTAWVTFSFATGKGTLPLTLTASDPDGAGDTATFVLELGPAAGSLAQVYSGRTSPCLAPGINSGATVHWRLRLRDLFGDTASSSGTLVAPPPPAGMVAIPAGTFQMGSTASSDEQPIHSVTVSSFWMDTTEVTQGRYAALMATTYSGYSSPSWSSYGTGSAYPAYYVNWYDAALYCNARTKERGSVDTVYRYTSISDTPGNHCVLNGLSVDLTKKGFRLPTEAEWEYACRAGTTTTYYWGEATDAATVGTYAWYSSNSGSTTHPVATKQKNAFGLYDMSGNVWEWCNDWYGGYTAGAVTDPTGAASGSYRVLRGGSWLNYFEDLRSANRVYIYPDDRNYSLYGFRCILPR